MDKNGKRDLYRRISRLQGEVEEARDEAREGFNHVEIDQLLFKAEDHLREACNQIRKNLGYQLAAEFLGKGDKVEV